NSTPRRDVCQRSARCIRLKFAKDTAWEGTTSVVPHNRFLGSESPKFILRLPANLALNRKQAAAQPLARCRRRSHIQSPDLSAANRAGRNIADRHFHDSIDLTVRRHSDNASAIVPAVPQITFAVAGRAIRQPAIKILKELPFV